MKTSELSVKVALTVLRPVDVVFDAVKDPAKMAHYFIAWGSGPMDEGEKVYWRFPELDAQFPILVRRVVPNQQIVYAWCDEQNVETEVEILFERKGDNQTMVRIREGARPADEAGIRWLMRNTEGWANFLACLKAWLEFGINLRKGAFDISQMTGSD